MFKDESPRDSINFFTINHIDWTAFDPFGNSENLPQGSVSMVTEILEKRLTYIALTLGIIAIAGSLLIGVNIVSVTTAEIEEQFEQFYLTKARSLAALSVPVLQNSDSALLGQIYEVWNAEQNLPADEYICVVNHASELILHSSDPQSIGEDVGRNRLTEPWKDAACSLGDLVKVPRDYVGGYISSSGENQIAAFAPIPDRGWVIGIHRSKRILHDTIRAKLNTQIWGMLSISLGIIPLALGLLYFSFIRINRERKQAEEELRKLSVAVKQSPVSILITDKKGNIEYVNPKFMELTGYGLHEVIGQKSSLLKSGEQPDSYYKKLWTTISSGKTWTGEFHNKKKNGELFWESARISPIFDDSGIITQYIAIKEDITERKQAEEKIIQSEEKYRTLVLNVPGMTYRGNPDWSTNIISNSETVCGYPPDDFITQKVNWPDIIHPDDKQRVYEESSKLLEKPQSIRQEYRIIEIAGGTRWVSDHRTSYFKDDGSLLGIDGIVFDITERKLVEAERLADGRRARLHRRALAELATNPFLTEINTKLAFQHIARTLAETFKVSRASIWLLSEDESKLHCQTLYERDINTFSCGGELTASDIPRYFKAIMEENRINTDNAQNDPRTSELTESYLKPLGITSLLDSGIIIEGRLAGVVCSEQIGPKRKWHTDEESFVSTLAAITAQLLVNIKRKQAEEALRESEELNRSITEHAADAIITINEDGMVLSWNQAAEDIFGYSADEMVNMDLNNIIPIPHLDAHRSGIANLKAGGPASIIWNKVEITAHQKNGSEIPIAMSLSSWTSKGHLHFTGIIRDITNRKKAEADIAKSLLEAKAANEVKDQFIANISHEIRTPLNSILGFSDLFKQRYGDVVSVRDKDIFQFITNSSYRLMRTVDSILNISQLEAGSIKIEPRGLDLNYIVRAVVGEVKPQADEKGLDLTYVPTDEYAMVNVDNFSVHQAILNLVDNAIKYTIEGNIELTLIQKGDCFRLSIQDTGIGISEEYQKRIFNPYTQESEGFTKNYQGIGLGLALTKRYLDLNGIGLELESTKNVGSTFTLIFPKHAGSDHV